MIMLAYHLILLVCAYYTSHTGHIRKYLTINLIKHGKYLA